MIIPKNLVMKFITTQPAQRLEIYYELMVVIILVPAVLFIVAILWLKKKPNLPQSKPGAVKI